MGGQQRVLKVLACSRILCTGIAVNKLLQVSRRRLMGFFVVLNQGKRVAKFPMQATGAVTNDRQTTALGRPVFGKRGNDHMAARFDRPQHRGHISNALRGLRQKVKNGPIMPDIKSVHRQHNPGIVCRNPPNRPALTTQPPLCRLQGGFGKIQHGQMLVARCQQIIYQRGGSTTHVNDGSRSGHASGGNKLQRLVSVGWYQLTLSEAFAV